MKLICLFWAMLFPAWLLSCDICNTYTGINPGDFQNSVGIMYRQRNLYGSYTTTNPNLHRHSSTWTPNTEIKIQFQVIDIRGRYYLNDKSFVQAILPMVINREIVNNKTTVDVIGIGDFSCAFYFQLFQKEKKKKNKTYAQRLFLGAGFKIPTGMKNLRYERNKVDLEMQGSTGSFDFILASQYSALFGKFGMNQLNSFKLNTRGSSNYRFGNTLNTSISFFRRLPIRKIVTLAPTTGLFFETAGNDVENHIMQAKTKNTVLFYSLGLNIFTKTFNLEVNWQPTVKNADETIQIPVQNRWILGLQINL